MHPERGESRTARNPFESRAVFRLNSLENKAFFIGRNPFENRAVFRLLGQAAVYAAAGGALMGDDAPSGDGCTLHGDACSLPGVENGVYTGGPDDLQALIAAGENPDAEHVPADEVSRSPAVKAAFLEAHGIEDPGDWQVHHIEPVSMGGADAPENMVLISPEDHQAVTAAHAEYYKWGDRG